jgi:hypothetical protein
MKNIFKLLLFALIIASGCNKDENPEMEEKQELYKSNLAFINADWTFEMTGDSLKDHIIGLWLSNEVSYDDIISEEGDSLFTWVIESTGSMVKRNNFWGDNETKYGNWDVDANKDFIFFSYKVFAIGGILSDYEIMTDTISIKYLSKPNLWTSHFIDYPPTTKMDIKFIKLK